MPSPQTSAEAARIISATREVLDTAFSRRSPFSVPSVFPNTGDLQPLPKGQTEVDLHNGVVLRPDGVRLPTLQFGVARSMTMFTDAPVQVELRLAGAASGFYSLIGPSQPTISAALFDSLSINAPSGANVQMMFSKNPRPPITASTDATNKVMTRYFLASDLPDNEVGNDLAVKMVSDPDGGIANKDGAIVLDTTYLQTRTIYIDNNHPDGSSQNAVTVKLQSRNVDGEAWFTDLAIAVGDGFTETGITARKAAQTRITIDKSAVDSGGVTQKTKVIFYGQTKLRQQ